MQEPTAVRERVQELGNCDNDRFAATNLMMWVGQKNPVLWPCMKSLMVYHWWKMKGWQGRLEYFTCAPITNIIYMQYFDRQDALGRLILTCKHIQPLTRVTISLIETALLCTLHTLRNGTATPGFPISFYSTTYKGTSKLQNVNKNKKQLLTLSTCIILTERMH